MTFLERDVPWYASTREFDTAAYCDIFLYQSVDDLKHRFGEQIRSADVVVLGSYVPDGTEVGQWLTTVAKGCLAFYDIDTPITLASLEQNACTYLSYELIPKFHLYLSFTSGPILRHLETLGSPCAQALYCSVDADCYFPEASDKAWDVGYLGTYAIDRQPKLDQFLIGPAERNPASRFVVAGPQYPQGIAWPVNVDRIEHLPPAEHRSFYNRQRFALNLTRSSMVTAGFSPSVRLFEASACGTPILTDSWEGLDCFYEPGSEILVVTNEEDVCTHLQMPECDRVAIAESARARTLKFHSSAVRAHEFEAMVNKVLNVG